MLALPPAVGEKPVLGEAPSSHTCGARGNCAVLRAEVATAQLRSKRFPAAQAAGLTSATFYVAIYSLCLELLPLAFARHFSLSYLMTKLV